MVTSKEKIVSLLKTHINYISIFIIFFGLMIRYSLPSFYPSLINLDIMFFGGIFIVLGISILAGNRLIDKYKEEVNEVLFSKIIDKKIGLKGIPLLTELMNMINPFSYNVGSHEIESIIKKSNDPNSKKYDIIQTRKIKVYPKQDNVYYVFGASTSEDNKKPLIDYVKLNGTELILSKDVEKAPCPYMNDSMDMTNYKILIPLKAGREYIIEIKTTYPSCMDDLNKGQEYDWHEYTFFALTERATLKHKYNFKDFEKYEFNVEKRQMNLPDVVKVDYEINIQKKEVIVKSGNLKNGDRIYLTYKKKKS